MNSTRTGYKLVHQPDFSPEVARVELLSGDGAPLAHVSYHKESKQLSISCFLELPAHFVHKFLHHSKRLLLPLTPFRPRQHFSLLDRRNLDPNKYIWEQTLKDVWLTDDLLQLLFPALNWLPVYIERTDRAGDFFDAYSTQEIRHDGAPILAKILDHWIGIFSLGPPEIVFVGGLSHPWVDDGTEEGTWYLEDGQPSRVPFDRDECINCMTAVRDMSQKLMKSDEHYFIYHEGL